MTEQTDYAKVSHWRCRRCGHRTPLGESICSNPNCRGELSIFGEVCSPASEEGNTDSQLHEKEANPFTHKEADIWEDTPTDTTSEKKAGPAAKNAKKRRSKKQCNGKAGQAPAEDFAQHQKTVRKSPEGLRQMPAWVFALLAVLTFLVPLIFFVQIVKTRYGPSRWNVIYAAMVVIVIASIGLLILTVRRWKREQRFRNAFCRLCAIILLLGLLCLPTVWMYYIGVQSSALVALAAAIVLFLLTKKDPAVSAFLFLAVVLRYIVIYGAIPVYFMQIGFNW